MRRRVVTSGAFSRKEILGWRRAIHEARLASDAATVIPFLSHADADARMMAAWTLGKIGDPIAIKPLRRLLQSESDPVQCSVIRALGNLGDEETREQIYDLATSDRVSPQVQAAALRARKDVNDPTPAVQTRGRFTIELAGVNCGPGGTNRGNDNRHDLIQNTTHSLKLVILRASAR